MDNVLTTLGNMVGLQAQGNSDKMNYNRNLSPQIMPNYKKGIKGVLYTTKSTSTRAKRAKQGECGRNEIYFSTLTFSILIFPSPSFYVGEVDHWQLACVNLIDISF